MAQWIWDKTIAHKQANKLDTIPIPMGDKKFQVTTPFFVDSKDPSKGRPLHTPSIDTRLVDFAFFSYVEPKEENQHNQTCLFTHDLCND